MKNLDGTEGLITILSVFAGILLFWITSGIYSPLNKKEPVKKDPIPCEEYQNEEMEYLRSNIA